MGSTVFGQEFVDLLRSAADEFERIERSGNIDFGEGRIGFEAVD